MFFLFTNIETNCWTIQNMERTVVFWFTLVYAIHVLQCLHAIVDIMPIIRKPPRFWYLKSWDRVSSWTFLYIELCWLWVIFLFAIPEIYYDDSLGAFLWVIWIMISDPRSLTWFIKGTDESMAREDSSVPLMHRWSQITDPDPDNPKEMHPLSLLNFLLKNLQVKLLILLGQKLLAMLISNTQHMIH